MYTCLELAVEFQCAAVIEVIAANPTPGSGYMAVGNHQGKVLLWRLNHYQVI